MCPKPSWSETCFVICVGSTSRSVDKHFHVANAVTATWLRSIRISRVIWRKRKDKEVYKLVEVRYIEARFYYENTADSALLCSCGICAVNSRHSQKQSLCADHLGEEKTRPRNLAAKASVIIKLAPQDGVSHKGHPRARSRLWLWESETQCRVTLDGQGTTHRSLHRGFVIWNILSQKPCQEKECRHLDKSACFQSDRSENLKIFLCARSQEGDIVQGKGMVVFWHLAIGVMQFARFYRY